MTRAILHLTIIAICFPAWLPGCDGDPSYLLVIRFPDEESREETRRLQVMAIRPGTGDTCGSLLDGSAVPGDDGYTIESELEFDPADADPGHLRQVGTGMRLFYALGANAGGDVIVHGCTEATGGVEGEIVILLARVGETCGQDSDCIDDSFCNGEERCADGFCVRDERDCTPLDEACVLGVCNESAGACEPEQLADGTVCDDGDGCTADDECTDGACEGTDLDCSSLDDDCNRGACDPVLGDCRKQPANPGGDCDDGDPCTVGDACDDTGACLAGAGTKDGDGDGHVDADCGGDDCDDSEPAVHPDNREGPSGAALCQDGLDNDCDAETDADDPDCGIAWWDTDWSSRRRIVFDNSTQGEDLVDFPVLVALDATRVDYAKTRGAGQDLRFVDADQSTVLDHEIERWDESGTSFVWVRAGLIPGGSIDSHIWMYHGNSSAPDGQNPPGVWSAGYLAVWHLGEPAVDEDTTAVHADSTGNSNDGIQGGNEGVTGFIGGGQLFDGVDDFVKVAQAGLQFAGDGITVEAWALPTGQPHVYHYVAGGGSDGRYWQLWWANEAPNGWEGSLRVAGVRRTIYDTAAGSLDSWNHVAILYDGADVHLYLDGEVAGTTTTPGGNLDTLNSDLWIGNNPVLTPREFMGIIDEVRISTVGRSEDWLVAQLQSMQDAFVTYGAEETW